MLLYLNKHPDTELPDLSYTLCGRRMHHPFRLGTPVSSLSGFKNSCVPLWKRARMLTCCRFRLILLP